MAVSFDRSTSATPVSSASSLTFSHTCNGQRRGLFVGAGAEINGVTLSGITFGGVAMSARWNAAFDTFFWYAGFTLLNPTLGPANVVVSMSGTADKIYAGAVSATEVHQVAASSFGTPKTSASQNVSVGNPSTINVVDVNPEDLVVDMISTSNASGVLTPGAGQTLRAASGADLTTLVKLSTQRGADGGLMTWDVDFSAVTVSAGGIAFKAAPAPLVVRWYKSGRRVFNERHPLASAVLAAYDFAQPSIAQTLVKGSSRWRLSQGTLGTPGRIVRGSDNENGPYTLIPAGSYLTTSVPVDADVELLEFAAYLDFELVASQVNTARLFGADDNFEVNFNVGGGLLQFDAFASSPDAATAVTAGERRRFGVQVSAAQNLTELYHNGINEISGSYAAGSTSSQPFVVNGRPGAETGGETVKWYKLILFRRPLSAGEQRALAQRSGPTSAEEFFVDELLPYLVPSSASLGKWYLRPLDEVYVDWQRQTPYTFSGTPERGWFTMDGQTKYAISNTDGGLVSNVDSDRSFTFERVFPRNQFMEWEYGKTNSTETQFWFRVQRRDTTFDCVCLFNFAETFFWGVFLNGGLSTTGAASFGYAPIKGDVIRAELFGNEGRVYLNGRRVLVETIPSVGFGLGAGRMGINLYSGTLPSIAWARFGGMPAEVAVNPSDARRFGAVFVPFATGDASPVAWDGEQRERLSWLNFGVAPALPRVMPPAGDP